MALGKNKKIINLVQSISEMKEENYAADSPELQNMYELHERWQTSACTGIWGRYACSYDNECLRPESWT